ncbi:MAG: gliding motility protein GldM [Flavobacteriaceae bacterium]|nr:gliding motility protein GldM [Flavobacteriaceae bacterium]
MAGGKLSPRQKMINLMYLVFIAMLAMNMSKEVLTAFGFMNDKFEASNITATQLNNDAYAGLAEKVSEQAEKYRPLNEKATKVKALSTDLYNHIATIKSKVLEDFEDPTNYETMDKADFLNEYFYLKGTISENGQAFLDKINGYKSDVIKELDTLYPSVVKSINQRFDISDVVDRAGVTKDWISYNFVGFPAVASVTKLTAMQADIKSTESDILSAMLQGQLIQDNSIKKYEAIVVPEKTAFFAGETFKGKVYLGKVDATLIPTRVEINGKEIAKKNLQAGQVVLEFPVGAVGERTIKGKFVFKENGEDVEIPIETTYAVVPKPNSAVIAADKMNVVYRSLPNPMTVSIPGIPDNLVRASAPGNTLRKISGVGKYMMTPGGGKTVKITASGTLPDGSKVSSSQTFRIKDIPKPLATVRKESGYVKMPKSSLVKTTVRVELPDFLFDLKFKIKSFKVKVPGKATITVSGSKMNGQAQSAINGSRVGDIIAIFDVKSSLVGVSGVNVKDASAVSVEIQ